MSTKSLFLLVLFLFSNYSQAANSYTDKNNVLAQLDQVIGGKSLAEAFPCDQSVDYKQYVESCEYSCEGIFCMGVCQGPLEGNDYSVFVGQCAKNEVVIYSDLGDVIEYSLKSFSALNGNVLRSFIVGIDDLIGYKGRLEIESSEPGKFTMDAGTSNEHKIDVLNVKGIWYFEELPYSEDFIITVAKDLPTLAQPLRFRMGGTTFFRLQSY